MGVEAREEVILLFMEGYDLFLPGFVVHYHIDDRYPGVSWEPETTKRRLDAMAGDGRVEKIDDGRGMYRITDAGVDWLIERGTISPND